ncbi:MAG: hypothetical protein CM15mP89_0090 [Gammaproteobacteria bacterium]|nr:MAG: hypothetical protein CM15mP89_0090 [Gammaproteobacteria bacterium]
MLHRVDRSHCHRLRKHRPEERGACGNTAKGTHNLVDWEAKGKAAFTYQGVTEAARFHWARSTPQNDVVALSGPFSMNRQTIERRDDQLIWRDGEQARPLSDLGPDSPALTALAAIRQTRWVAGYWALNLTHLTGKST